MKKFSKRSFAFLVIFALNLFLGYFVVRQVEAGESVLDESVEVLEVYPEEQSMVFRSEIGYRVVSGLFLKANVPPYYLKTNELEYRNSGNMIDKIIMCESSWDNTKWGDLGKEYPAYGLAQFQERTFYWLANLADKELNWKNATDQVWLLRWAIDNNYGYLWTCYGYLTN